MPDEILVICSDGHHGDAIMSLPAICGLAESHDTVYLAMYNRQVLKIADLPANVVDALQSEPRFVQQPMEVLWLAAGAACDYSPGQEPAMSLIHRFMLRAGLPIDPDVLPQPRINVPEVAEHDEANARLRCAARALDDRCRANDDAQAGAPALPRARAAGGRAGGRQGRPAHRVLRSSVRRGLRVRGTHHAPREMRCDRRRVSRTAGSRGGIGPKHIGLDAPITGWICQSHADQVRVKGWHEGPQATWKIEDIVDAVKAVVR